MKNQIKGWITKISLESLTSTFKMHTKVLVDKRLGRGNGQEKFNYDRRDC